MIDFLKKELPTNLVKDLIKSNKEKLVWCILIVDDDPEVHSVTRLALRDFQFEERGLNIISAYSAEEAKAIFEDRTDISLALVDVVMENDHAGLDLVRHLRVAKANHKVRLVLRTGQPGQAPEDRIVKEYDIDDYREKTDLTKQKLYTLLYSMLRSYRDLSVIELQRDGLQHVIQSCAKVQSASSFKNFAIAALEQMIILQHFNDSEIYCIEVPNKNKIDQTTKILITTPSVNNFEKEGSFDTLPPIIASRFNEVLGLKTSKHYPDAYVFYLANKEHSIASDCSVTAKHANNDQYDSGAKHNARPDNSSSLVYITHHSALTDLDQQLLEIYVQNLAITFDNINLRDDLQEASRELIFTLSDTMEARSNETGAHIQRVAYASERLAQLAGLSEHDATLIKLASPLHDIGKIAIPDAILHKAGKLDPAEWEIMKKHVDYGVVILGRSRSELMVVATQIAGTHHERWNGTGYPEALKGEAIPIAGRITALADVFDGLGSKRSYKEPWTSDEILALIIDERGKHFDPRLVDLFIAHYDEFLEIRAQNPDTYTNTH